MTLTEARNRLLEVAERLERDPAAAVTVMKRGKRVMTVLGADAYDALVETLEILGDVEATAKLRAAVREADASETVSWRGARRSLLR